MCSFRLFFRILLPGFLLFFANPLLAQDSELRGQVTDAGTGLPIEGAVVSVEVGGVPQLSTTTGPFGFYEIPGISTGTFDIKAIHLVYNEIIETRTFGSAERAKQNFRLTLRAEITSPDSFFDIFVQVNGAVSGWGLVNCPVVIERFAAAGDAAPATSFTLQTDAGGAVTLHGALAGFYRFKINTAGDPGARSKWESFTTEGKANDKSLIDQPHMAQVYLKPDEQTLTFRVVEPNNLDVTDPSAFDPVLMKGVFVTLEGFDPTNPNIPVIPPRTGVTDDMGEVTFKRLPGVRYKAMPKRLGYFPEEKIIDPDVDGALPTGIQQLDLTYEDRFLKVRFVHNYQDTFLADYIGNKLVGIKGTNTEGIERTYFHFFADPLTEFAFYDYLLPGRYRVTATGQAASGVQMQTGQAEELEEFFAGQAVGEVFVEVSKLGQTTVDLPVEFQPTTVRGRLMAADRRSEPEDQLAYLPVANKVITFKEKEGVDILPVGQKEVSVTTDASGQFTLTILPGIYGILVAGMDEYWGEAVIETPIASSSLAAILGEGSRKEWPMWERWPHAFGISSAIDNFFDVTGIPIGEHDIVELELLLRKDVVQVRVPVQIIGDNSISFDPTLFLIPGFTKNSFDEDVPLLSVGYRDIVALGDPKLTPVVGGAVINGTMANDFTTDVQATWVDVPPGEYDFSITHPRFNTNPPQRISVFDYPSPGNAPTMNFDDFPRTGDNDVSAPLNLITTEQVTSTFPGITEAVINTQFWNSTNEAYDPAVQTTVDLVSVGYVSGLFSGPGAPPTGWTNGWVNENGGWISVAPGSTIRVGTGGPSNTVPDGPPVITTNFTVEARLKNDLTRTVNGVNFRVQDDVGDNFVTPFANAAFTRTSSISQPFGVDNWVWENLNPTPEVSISGTINIKQTIIVDQGMEAVITVRNSETLAFMENVSVELLASNGVPLRNFNTFSGRTKFPTDANGVVTFNSIPGFRDYFVRIEAPGFQPMLHRLDASAATEVINDPSTNFRHTVTLDLTLLPRPEITTTGVPLDREGAFLPGVNKTGGQDAFSLTAEATLTATWNLRIRRKTHNYQLPGFDLPDGSAGPAQNVTMVDDIEEVWLVDRREFAKDFYSSDPTVLNLPPSTDPVAIAQVLSNFSKLPDFGETKSATFFSRSKTVTEFDAAANLFDATGKIKLWELPPGDFDPVLIVIAKSGSTAIYDVPYTGMDEAKRLTGVPIPPWLAFAFDIIGFAGGVATTQEEIKKFVPDGKFLPFPEFTATIARHKEMDVDTNFIDYEYKLTLLQKEGQDTPGANLTGLAAGIVGAEFKSEAAITMPGKDKKLALSITSTVKKEDIEIKNFEPKLLKGFKPDTKFSVEGSVTTEAAKNVDPGAPWDVRLTNQVNFNMDSSFEMNLQPILGKMPYVGPALTALDKFNVLSFFGTTGAGAGLDTTFCWETVRPQDITFGTTIDPDPQVRRRHFLGGNEPENSGDPDCANAYKLCFRFDVGLKADAIGGNAGMTGKIKLTGDDCGGKPSVTITPNAFGDWPPIKRINGEATANIDAFLKTPIKEFKKEWSWSLLKFDAQFGTETLFQLIPMEITRSVSTLTIFPNPDFKGASPGLVDDFIPLGNLDAATGGRVLFIDKDMTTGDMRLLLAEETGPSQFGAPTVLSTAPAILQPQILELGDGRVLVAWAQIESADIDDPFAPSNLQYVLSDNAGGNFSTAATIGPLSGAPASLRLVQSGTLVALVALDSVGGAVSGDSQIRASSFAGGAWSSLADFGTTESIAAFDVAATGPTGPAEVHIHYVSGNAALNYYRWDGMTTPGAATQIGTTGWQGNISSQATPDGVYRITGVHETLGFSFYSAGTPAGAYAKSTTFALNVLPVELETVFLDDATQPAILFVWTETGLDSVSISYAFTDPEGNLLGQIQSLTGNPLGRYSSLRVAPESGQKARIFTLFENSPLQLRTFVISLADGATGNDSDADGMNDLAELLVVDFDSLDAFTTVNDVLPGDDFDNDTFTNQEEIDAGTNPADPLSFPTLGGVVINATQPTAREFGNVPGLFTVQRPSGDLSQILNVLYSVSGSATADADYTALPASLEIPIDNDIGTLTVTPISDSLPEGDESVTVTLQPDAAYTIAEPSAATVTIKDIPIDDWRRRMFPTKFDSADADDLSDPESDGITNLLEYALDLDPGVPDTINLPGLSIFTDPSDSKQYLAITYTMSTEAADLTYTVEVTADLANGPWLTGAGQVLDISTGGEVDTQGNAIIRVRDTVPLDDAGAITRFIRLRVGR